jgi:precorrin-2/cobalt-factor-2 C20-methyltransferase
MKLYGVGVGPGDPELLTLKAHRLLTTVPVLFVPVRRAGEPSYAATIASAYLADPTRRVVELVYPMTKDLAVVRQAVAGNAATIAAQVAAAGAGAFLTEGDPLLYSTFLHTFAALRSAHPEVEVEIVPGVSSVTAAAAVAQWPLADRDERLAILPATYERDRLRQTLCDFDTVVLLKVNSVMDAVLDLLAELDLLDGAVYVRRCGRPEQEIVRDVRVLRGQKLDYFSLLLVRGLGGRR